MRLRVSARACVRDRRTPSISSSINRDTTSSAGVSRGERPLAFVDLLVDVLRELGERVGESLSPLGAVAERELALHQFLRQTGDAVGVVRREPEQVDRDTVRERHGERGDEVGTHRAVQLGEEVVGRGADERLRFVDDRRRQRGDHHAPHERMLRGSSSPRMRSSNGMTTPGAFIPDAFENDVVSRMTARHSDQRVTYGRSPATVATALRAQLPEATATRPGPPRTDRTRTPRSSPHSDKDRASRDRVAEC